MKNVVLTALVLTASASISNAETLFNQMIHRTVNHGFSGHAHHGYGYAGHSSCNSCGGGCGSRCGISGWGGRGLFGHGCGNGCADSCTSYTSCKRRCDLFAYFHGGTYCTNFCSMGCSEGLNYLKYRLRKCSRGLRHGCCGCCPYTGYRSPYQMGCGCHGGHGHGHSEVIESTPAEAESNQEELKTPLPPMPPMDPQPTPPAADAKSARVPAGSRLLGIVF